MCNEALGINPLSLPYVPDRFKTQEMCDAAVRKGPCELEFVPDHFKTQKMCNEAVPIYPYLHVPEHLKTHEMCDNAVRDDSPSFQYVPDWFVTREGVYMWHDDYYYDDGDCWVTGVMMMEVNFLSGTMFTKNRRPRRHKLRKNSCPLLGIHQDDEIGVIQKTRK